MGDRAIYAIRRAGSRKVDVRYAHWGSSFLFSDIFWGPQHAAAHIEALTRGDWLDDVWGEAAAALCYKTKTLALYTYQLDAPTAKTAFRVMQPLWPGWNLAWGSRVSEVAHAVGVDLVRRWSRYFVKGAKGTMDYVLSKWQLADLGKRYRKDAADEYFSFGGVVSVRRGRGRATEQRDYLSDVGLDNALYFGPSLVDALPRLPTVEAAAPTLRRLRRIGLENSVADIFAGSDMHALIEPARRRLVVTVKPGLEELEQVAKAHAFAVAWPGWDLVIQRGGLSGHFATCERPAPRLLRYPAQPAARAAPVARRLAWIHDLLFESDERKEEGAALLDRVAGEHEARVRAAPKGTVVMVNPGVSQSIPPTVLTRRRRQALWQRALRESGLGGTRTRR